jgi:hypothetical protein
LTHRDREEQKGALRFEQATERTENEKGESLFPLFSPVQKPACFHLALAVLEHSFIEPAIPTTPVDRVRQTLAQLQEPAPLNHLRQLCEAQTLAQKLGLPLDEQCVT